jgi:AcrR family transcriptional regulator
LAQRPDSASLFAFMTLSPGSQPTARRKPEAISGPASHKLRPDDGRLVRGRKSRERIRKAARELFREEGFDGATLRAIAKRAGMGASSIYRHVQSKEELLVDELDAIQEEAWKRFRTADDRARPTRQRVHEFLDVQHALLVRDRDLTMIALRAATKPEARVARRALVLNDRTIGLLAEILQMGRKRKDLVADINVLDAASALFHITQGARLPWANGLVSADACQRSILAGVDLMFRGLHAPEAPWWKK